MSLAFGVLVYLLGPALAEAAPAPSPPADAPPARGPATPLVERLAGDKALKGLDLGVSVRCTDDHVAWGGNHAATPMSPASGAKLLTSAAALKLLSPDRTFETRVLGRLENGIAREVVVVAGADPSLTLDDLDKLAEQVHAAGATRIDGGITFDLSTFAGSSTPPAYNTKNVDAGYRPEVPAFAVGSALFVATVTPGKKVGDPVRVTTSLLARSLDVDNQATTAAGKGLDKLVIEARAAPEGHTRLVVSGTLGVAAGPQAAKKRLADPARTAAELFARALANKGVSVDGALRFYPAAGHPEDTAPRTADLVALAHLTSDTLAADLKETNTTSNNFMAETIFKHLGADGARLDGPATWERAADHAKGALTALGLPASGFVIVNGSGLYEGTKVSPDAMTELLALEAVDTPAGRSFRDSLAVAGTSGTLKGRLLKLTGKVRGKTGTLDNALSLSGYVPAKACLLAFSVLVNGDIGGRGPTVNRRIDSFVLDLARL